MTARQWLAGRTPQPPADLASALAQAVGPGAAGDAAPLSLQLLAAARRTLPSAIAEDCADRSGALNLLTLDALITYAMEAGSATAAECEDVAAEALLLIGEAATPE